MSLARVASPASSSCSMDSFSSAQMPAHKASPAWHGVWWPGTSSYWRVPPATLTHFVMECLWRDTSSEQIPPAIQRMDFQQDPLAQTLQQGLSPGMGGGGLFHGILPKPFLYLLFLYFIESLYFLLANPSLFQSPITVNIFFYIKLCLFILLCAFSLLTGPRLRQTPRSKIKMKHFLNLKTSYWVLDIKSNFSLTKTTMKYSVF